MLPVAITPQEHSAVTPGQIEIAFRNCTIRVGGDVDQEALKIVFDVLEERL